MVMAGLLGLFIYSPVGGSSGIEDTGMDIDVQDPNYGFFTENIGQWDNGIDFIGSTSFGKIGLDGNGVYFDLYDPVEMTEDPTEEVEREGGHILGLSFSGSYQTELTGYGMLGHKNNYMIGSDESDWVTGVSNFRTVEYSKLYDGIQLEYMYGEEGVKYEYHLAPYADPDDIRIEVSGHQSLKAYGDTLDIIASEVHTLSDTGLVAFYSDGANEVIPSSFEIIDRNMFGFTLAAYDTSRPVTIDPILAATYIGGTSSEYCYSSARDSSDNIYVTGYTGSSNYPTTTGAYDTSRSGNDLFITKINSGLSSLSYSTFLGGSGSDYGYGIAVDSSGYAYVTGYTYSSNFPTSTNAFQSSLSSSPDTFATKLDTDGDSIIYSTYIGGSSYDYGYDIWEDGGKAYITGRTRSTNFPTTSNAYDTSKGGSSTSYDAFYTVVNSNGQSLYCSSYFGGTDTDYGYGIRTDSWGYVYIAGRTYSATYESFPYVSYRGYDKSLSGSADNFVAGLYVGSTYSSLYSSTYLGGSSYEYCYYGCLDVDDDDEFYMVGYSSSTNYPTVTGDYDTTTYSSSNKVVVTKLSNSLSILRGSTYIEGSSSDYGYGIDVDDDENVYVVGRTGSSNFPLASEDVSTRPGSYSAFLSKLSADFDDLEYSSYFGGTASTDYFYDVEADSMTDYMNAYGCGYTGSSGLATTGAYQTTKQSTSQYSYDVIIAKIRTYVPDYVPPTFGTDGSDTIATTGDTYSFSIVATDNVAVVGVGVYYWFGSGPMSFMTLTGSSPYTGTITIPWDSTVSLNYIFEAYDAKYNWAYSSQKTITVSDNDPPHAANVTSDLPTTGDPYVLTVEFFDNIDGNVMNQAYVFASYDPLDWSGGINLTLTYNGVTGFYEAPSVNIIHSLGPLYYNLSAMDNSGNWGSFSGETVIVDNDNPVITGDTTVASTGWTGDIFNFSATVEDNVEVDSVYVNYRFSDGGHYEMVELTERSGDIYYLHKPLEDHIPVMIYNFTALDTSGNRDDLHGKRVTIIDNDSPEIFTDMCPKKAEAGQKAYPFRVMVSDNINLVEVKLTYWFDFQTGETTVTMNHLSGDVFYWQEDLPQDAGQMSYKFWAIDNSSNEYTLDDNMNVQILDILAPEIGTPTYADEATTGDTYGISVDITDDVEVSNVRFYYYFGDVMPEVVPYIDGTASGNTYSISIDIPDSLDMLHFWVEGFDNSNNGVTSTVYDVIVLDNDDPVFDSFLSDTEAATGEDFLFKVNASDNIELDHVDVTYTLTGEEPVTVMMMQNMSSFCHMITLPNDNDQFIEFHFTVYDTSGNMMVSDETFNVSIIDDEEPLVMIESLDEAFQHEDVTFSGAMSTDNIGLISYTWEIMNETYTGEEVMHSFDDVGEYTVTLVVSDGVNPAQETSKNITIRDADDPVLDLVVPEEIGNHELVTGDVSGSTDNVGIVAYEWRMVLPDNSVEEFTGPSFEYDLLGALGEVTVYVTIYDAEGNKASESAVILVKDILPPVAVGPEDTQLFEDNTMKFTDMGSTDNVGVVDWVWFVNSDDGEEVFVTQDLVYFFEDPGEYNISLRVSDSAGNNDTTSFIVTVKEKGADFDNDKDGMPDDWEEQNGLDTTMDDHDRDPDGDLLSNLREFELGTDPKNPDTDGDGLPDNYEVKYMPVLDPITSGDQDEDPDGDGDKTIEEYLEGATARDPTVSDAEEEEDDNTLTIMIILILVAIIIIVLMVVLVIYAGKGREIPEDFPKEEFPHLHKE